MFFESLDIVKRFGGVIALNGVSIKLAKGELVGLIGPNGSGKTTFINVVSGVYRPDSGRIHFLGNDITDMPVHKRCKLGISRTFQIPQPFNSMSVWDNVVVAGEFCGSLDERFAREVIKDLGLHSRIHDAADKLSLVEKRLLELARALVTKPKLLLVDEILAGLRESEVNNVTSLISKLNEEGVAVLWVEHRVHDLVKVVERLIVFNFGTVIADGTPEIVLKDRTVIDAYLGKIA
jgi:branched-chain amino acid transport system ATP-binding protein